MTATVDPVNLAISSAEDADSLAELGYTQELHRGIGAYAAFASGFSFVSILTTVFALFALGFGLGCPAFFFTWPIVFVCQYRGRDGRRAVHQHRLAAPGGVRP